MKRKSGLILLGLLTGTAEIWLGWMVLPENFLGAYLIFIGLGYCIGGGFFLALGTNKDTDSQSDRSLVSFAPGGFLLLLGMPLEYLYLSEVLPRSQVIQWLGLTIILLGMILRLWTRRSLKEAYQGNLQVQPGQHLVKTGPYHWIRHPGYFAFALQALGLAIGFSSLIALQGLVLLVFALWYRIRIEEHMMIQAFGKEYIEYSSQTRRLIPRIW